MVAKTIYKEAKKKLSVKIKNRKSRKWKDEILKAGRNL